MPHLLQITRPSGDEHALTPPPELEEGHESSLSDRLEDAGLSEAQVASVAAIVEREADRLGYHRAAEVLREVFVRVANVSSAGAALAFALNMAEDRTLLALGAQFGQTKQNIGNKVRLLAPALGNLATSHAGKRPSQPGKWLTLTEAARRTGRTAAEIQVAARAGDLPRVFEGRQAFYDEQQVIEWAHRTLTNRASLDAQHQPLCTQKKHLPSPYS